MEKAVKPSSLSSSYPPLLRKYSYIVVVWSVLVAGSLAYNLHELAGITLNAAIAAARANINKDMSFRKWANSHGGVYVEPSASTPPNPYLTVPGRDVVTTAGKALTLMNPAYVLREMQANFGDDYGTRSHITSLKPINPKNAPDAWETKALKTFERGKKEYLELQQINGQPYVRLMKPFVTEKGCLKCHAKQGYKEGDLRGGIGTDVSLQPYLAKERVREMELTLTHSAIWLIGLTGLVVAYRRERKLDVRRDIAEHHLRESASSLKESMERTQMLLDSALDAVISMDHNGLVAGWSPQAERIFGISSEQAMGRDLSELIVPPQYREKHKQGMARFMSTGTPSIIGKRVELTAMRADGSEFPVELTVAAMRQQGNHFFSAYVRDISERKMAEAKIESLAFYDPLTHLPNRRLLLDRLQQALASSKRSGRDGALLFLDLDNFKTINDTLGHDIGDTLLQQVAERLTSCVREGDTIARLGGDEFVVMLKDLSTQPVEAAAQAEVTGKKILATLNHPYQLATHERVSTSSIGITLFNHLQTTGDELLKQADIAMYQAKKTGGNNLRFFDPEMQSTIITRATIESDLRQALGNHEFQLYYQIQVDDHHRPIGAEALIRWIQPEHGMVSPSTFIPLAEETGMILPIGEWVLETACAQINSWQNDALTRDLALAVNISAKQFRQDEFVAQVQALIHRHAINPKLLKLELTESLLLENIEGTVATMNALKEIGVQFSLDDFGTGYSSLQYIKRLPLDQLKIDQSFVRDIASDDNDKVIVGTIIAMAQSLNLEVIAEGVETADQQQFLLNKGCIQYQGYLFGRPLPVEEFEVLLKCSSSELI